MSRPGSGGGSVRPGLRLGTYVILAPLGAGGMGEVWRARDERLGREVAIKVLPAELSAERDRLKRFEKEARAASGLNHPNIVTIHAVDRTDATPFIVMELVEGKTLREVVADGPLPARKLLGIAVQIADGLARAHASGIVHRDLKPGNVMVTKEGLVKILDFGVAKLAQPERDSGQPIEAPTVPEATKPGIVMGTVGYMSPEQASGHPVDFRSDQFALGSILYEMATGNQAFKRATAAQTLTAIIEDEPEPIVARAPKTPAPLRWIIERCLAKEPAERYASTRDLARDLASVRDHVSEISGAPEIAPEAPGRRSRLVRERVAWAAAAAFLAGVALLAGLLLGKGGSAPRRFQASLEPPEKTSFSSQFAISPDGTRLVFATEDGRLWVRDFSQPRAGELAGVTNATYPFWSPDGRSVAFFVERKLKAIELSGGSPRTICDAPAGRGGAWSREGVILFAPDVAGPLFRVPAAGGEPAAVTALDASRREFAHRFPCFLSDGQRFLYLAGPTNPGPQNPPWIVAGSLDSKEAKSLVRAASAPACEPEGQLLYVRTDRTLVAQPFDERELKTTGPAVPVVELVSVFPPRYDRFFAVSGTGLLVYLSGGFAPSRLAWFDRAGKEVGSAGQALELSVPRLSPDGRRVAVELVEARSGTGDIWIYDLARSTDTRWTSDPADDASPVWSPDGREIVFRSYRKGMSDLYIGPADGAEPERLLLESPNEKIPTDWSADGKWLVFDVIDQKTRHDIWVLPLFGDRKPWPFLKTEFREFDARFLPDGHWLAYHSNQSGRFEVYVASFPGPGEKTQVSTAGGTFPRWSRNGREIFFVAEGKIWSAEIATAPSLKIGAPKLLMEGPPTGNGYDLSPDGQRFLMVQPDKDFRPPPLTVVFNWTAG